jgi:hypothetical protein
MRSCPLLYLALLPGAAACAAPPGAPSAEPSLRWALAEDRGELVLARERPRIEIRVSRPEAAVGETVEAEIRLPGGSGRRRGVVRPGRPGVRLDGPGEFELEGEGPVRVRFTAESPGPGGVVVELEDD